MNNNARFPHRRQHMWFLFKYFHSRSTQAHTTERRVHKLQNISRRLVAGGRAIKSLGTFRLFSPAFHSFSRDFFRVCRSCECRRGWNEVWQIFAIYHLNFVDSQVGRVGLERRAFCTGNCYLNSVTKPARHRFTPPKAKSIPLIRARNDLKNAKGERENVCDFIFFLTNENIFHFFAHYFSALCHI